MNARPVLPFPDVELDKAAVASTPAPGVLERLQCSEQGLTENEVAERRARYGLNALTKKPVTALRVLARQFASVLIYFLIVAAVLSFATGDTSDGVIITVILVINAALGFSQDYRSERAVKKLAQLISDRVTVRRDGKSTLVDVVSLVPGDIVILKEGDVIPADIKLLTADSLQVDESQLTGESVPVQKGVGVAEGPDGAASLCSTGSTVGQGELTGVVYAIGDATALGKIAALSTAIRTVTQYEKSLRAFSALLLKIIGLSLAVTLVVKVVLGGGGSHLALLLTFVVALAVAVVPEALPVIATLTLSRGALKLAKEKVVVKRLSSLQDLGNITLLCTDKTGTLTENKLTIQRLTSSDDRLFQTLAAAAIDQDSAKKEGTQSSFDAAFASYIPEELKAHAASLTITGEVPFDAAARRRRVVLADASGEAAYLVVIGSPETLLGIASCPTSGEYLKEIVDEGRQGLRHLAVAYKKVTAGTETDILAEETTGLIFLGFVTLVDPLRASTPQTIATAKRLGVAIKILTGDSAEVAGYVGERVGLVSDADPVYAGDSLERMAPDDFAAAVRTGSVFARVSPEQKYNIIQELKSSEVVGYQGDGINDAPALKLADVGIAVDSATEVAKANADIILLDRNLGVVINAIKYGRGVFVNINKYIKYTMVGNFGNFFALGLLYLFASGLPLLPRQVLLISLLTDLPLVAISSDAVAPGELEQPDKYDAGALLSLSLVLGTLTAIAELVFFVTLGGQSVHAKETSLYLFLMFTQLIVIVSIRNRDHFWKGVKPSLLLTAAVILTAAVGLSIPYLGPIGHLLSLSSPATSEMTAIVVATLIYLVVLDLVKVAYYKVVDRRHGASQGHTYAEGRMAARLTEGE